MKKLLLCLIAILMLCGCQKQEQPVVDDENVTTNEVEDDNKVEDSTSLADKYSMLFKEISTSENENITAEEIANKLVNENLTEASLVVEAVTEGPLAGFTVDITGFEEGYRFAPMIGTIPFVGYVFKTANPDSLISLLNDNHDLRWNICTEADNYSLSVTDNFVFVIMCSDAQA